ncbi:MULTISPECIES: hypothetical protein [unclassified Mesorhizobium]|uniref:hypothetical protein n=1 Tax=unclassified Mesorhizobium TaxID=325217 RepID=UPI001FE1E96F|nr:MULTISPECIES: hypothetical protein [unclassified Mesorhizobium]
MPSRNDGHLGSRADQRWRVTASQRDEILTLKIPRLGRQDRWRNSHVVIGTKDRWDYAVIASGGFFIAGKDSIVVPLRYLQVDEERNSFYLRISSADVNAVPLMPDQEYLWLADEAWRAKNERIFQKLIPDSVR